jgi:CHAT domain/FHA domain
MAESDLPCFNLVVDPLRLPGHFAVHVTRAPYPGGYVLSDGSWSDAINQLWQSWQEMFSTRRLPHVPQISKVQPDSRPLADPISLSEGEANQPVGRAGRLMQDLGIYLWRWLFEGAIQGSFDRSQGIAMGQGNALRIRLELRDPDLGALPWEIMQDGAGKQAIALSQYLLFSRTTADVYALPQLRTEHTLKILLVLGQDSDPGGGAVLGHPSEAQNLKLQAEAEALELVLKTAGSARGYSTPPAQVDTLVQPSPAELIQHLEAGNYNVFFYAGHGMPAPDGGMLFLRPDMKLNGTELAQVLTRCQVKLAVFNACWGAQPDHYSDHATTSFSGRSSQAIPRSSLAEVLIHHGVPAVLGMRDSITDEEALSFIQALAKALADRKPIDHAVAIARQHLLTLFKFNHQAWTLPVLYMHPEFDGELLKPLAETLTQLPAPVTRIGSAPPPAACLCAATDRKVWHIRDGVLRVGRDRTENDLVLPSDQAGVSRKHAVIFCRQIMREGQAETVFFLEDFSSFGTLVSSQEGWQRVHREEFTLHSGVQIKFGSSQNEAMEFVIRGSDTWTD